MKQFIEVFEVFTSQIEIEENISRTIHKCLKDNDMIDPDEFMRVKVNLFDRNFFPENVRSIHIQIYNRTMDHAVIFVSKKSKDDIRLRKLAIKKLLCMIKTAEDVMIQQLPKCLIDELKNEMTNCWRLRMKKTKKSISSEEKRTKSSVSF